MSLHSYIILYILCLVAYGQAVPIKQKPIVFMISYDAFGNYYFKLNITNHMKQFREEGVYSPYMRNVFPTKTFTNHFSIATGLYPSEHGVVENSLYDSELGALSYGYDLFHFKKDILPIWTLNEMNGGVSGCMMWPGSDFEYSNVSCTYTQKFNTSISLPERVDTAIQWLTHPDKPANLIMLYSEEPGQTGHRYGPHSEQTLQKVAEVNNLTKYIQDKLVEHNLLDETNVIHVSDRGMTGVTSDSGNIVDDDMEAYFMAKGPLFKKGHITNPFDIIDLYNLLCSILNIKNRPQTNGTLDTVSDTLVTKSSDTPWWVIFLFIFVFGYCFCSCCSACCGCSDDSSDDSSDNDSEGSPLLSRRSSTSDTHAQSDIVEEILRQLNALNNE